MTIQFTNTREAWSFNQTIPFQSLQVTQIAQDNAGADITLDDVTSAIGKPNIGDQYSGRSVYIKGITWTQITPKIAEAQITYDSALFNPNLYDEDNVQSSHADVAGYVNTDISASTYSVDWWRYRTPSGWLDGGTYPWSTASPTTAHQDELATAITASEVVDAAGTPLTRPVLGQQLVVALTFETKPTALRAYWRSLRGTRNSAAFLNDGAGEWLFTGANQHATTTSELFTVELSFYRDPYGWCRQRPKTDENGTFPLNYLIEVDGLASDDCAGSDKGLHAACVEWVQLHPALGDFSNLMTSAQMTQVEELNA